MEEREREERWSKKREKRIKGWWMEAVVVAVVAIVVARIFEWKSRRTKKRA